MSVEDHQETPLQPQHESKDDCCLFASQSFVDQMTRQPACRKKILNNGKFNWLEQLVPPPCLGLIDLVVGVGVGAVGGGSMVS
jgi:hypothetical protein